METPLNPPKSLLAVYDELIQAKTEYLDCRFSTRDYEKRDNLFDLLRRIENPSLNELKVLKELSKAKEAKEAKLSATETKLNRLCGKFRRECSKWLLGKLVHNKRHSRYMRVYSVTMEPPRDTSIMLHGPTLDDIRCESGIVYTKKSEADDILIDLGYVRKTDDPHLYLSKMLERYTLCDIDDIKAAMEERKDAWVKHFDLMKEEGAAFLNTTLTDDE